MENASPQPAKSVVHPASGEVITSIGTGNSFTIGDRIGEGSFAVVYACQDVWGNELAVKVFKPTGTYEQVREAANREFQLLINLRHPFLTFVHDAFEFRDTFYIVTERCHMTVRDLLAERPSFNGIAWVQPIARCLLQAVHFLHLNHTAHQDIHVGNVFAAFARDELAPHKPGGVCFKLGDLGVARLFSELGLDNLRARWMLPPEVLQPAEFGIIDQRADIYHVGLLLLQVASSRTLTFTEEEALAGLPREMALQLPPPLNLALEKALRRHTQARTASAMELWRDLQSPPQAPGPAAGTAGH